MELKLSNEETTAWMGFVKSQQYLIEKVEDELKLKGFPPLTWYDVLLELDKAHEGSLRLNDLGKKVLLNKYSVTRLIDRLEKEGLVSRDACQIDGRGIFACITQKGRELRKSMWPVYYNVIKEHFLSQFNKDELSQFIECVERIRTQFE
ncbi:MAG: MarR family winged helix-turn-helix transcriptional regulator [Thermodesulfobacteriota bacterium]